jgi:hypothetical protein
MSEQSVFTGNPCGGCTVCCEGFLSGTIPNFDNFELKPGHSCPAKTESGCNIYDQRPPICVKYVCRYKQHASWPLSWRPDNSGIVAGSSKKEDVKRLMVTITRQDYDKTLYEHLQKIAKQEDRKFVVVFPLGSKT